MTDAILLMATLIFGGLIGGFTALFLFTYPEDKEARAALKIITPKVQYMERSVKWLMHQDAASRMSNDYREAKQR